VRSLADWQNENDSRKRNSNLRLLTVSSVAIEGGRGRSAPVTSTLAGLTDRRHRDQSMCLLIPYSAAKSVLVFFELAAEHPI
jgi:hypothetical protein